MKLFLFTSLLSASAFGADLPAIKARKELRVGMREKDLVYKANGPKQLHTELAEGLAKKLGVKLKIVVVKDMKEFWSKNGEVKQGEEYTPDFFNKVDLYADTLTVNEWRSKLATPATFLHIKESFICNFKNTSKLVERIRAGEIPVYTVQASSYHTLLTKLQVPETSLKMVASTADLAPSVEADPNKVCAVLDSDQAVLKSQGKVKYSGPATLDNAQLAWWTATSSPKLNAAVNDYFKEIKADKTFDALFEKHYKMPLKIYYDLLTNIGWNSIAKAFK